jgi:3-polyprenyl-4-hydroxybenzoate decarboxylase
MKCRKTWTFLTNAEIQVTRLCKTTRPQSSIIILKPTASSADECTAAAEIYDCGKKKAPEIMDAIQDNLKKKSAAVPVKTVRQILLIIA